MAGQLVWWVGNQNPSITETIQNEDGTPHDLTGQTVKFRMRPVGSSTLKVDATATVVSAPAGTVRYDWLAADVDTAGSYLVWWQVTTTAGGKTQDMAEALVEFRAHADGTADLCALADVRASLEIPISDDSRDPLIASLITAASQAIMNEVDREFAPTTASATRRFKVEGLTVDLAPYDLRSATTITINPEGTSPSTLTVTSDYQLQPIGSPSGTYTAIAFSGLLASLFSSQTVFSFGYALCDITGSWGFPTVPPDVKRACVVTVGSWMRKDVSALIAAGELDMGAGGLQPAFPSTMEVPNAAKELLGPFYRLRAQVVV